MERQALEWAAGVGAEMQDAAADPAADPRAYRILSRFTDGKQVHLVGRSLLTGGRARFSTAPIRALHLRVLPNPNGDNALAMKVVRSLEAFEPIGHEWVPGLNPRDPLAPAELILLVLFATPKGRRGATNHLLATLGRWKEPIKVRRGRQGGPIVRPPKCVAGGKAIEADRGRDRR